MTCKTHFCNNRVPDARFLPSGGHFGPLPNGLTRGQQPKTTVKFSRHKQVEKNEWTSQETVEHEEPTNSVFRPRKFPTNPIKNKWSDRVQPTGRVQPKEKKSLKIQTSAMPTIPYRGPSYKYLGKNEKKRKSTTTSTTQVIPTTTTLATSSITVRSDKQKSMSLNPTIWASSKASLPRITCCLLMVHLLLLCL